MLRCSFVCSFVCLYYRSVWHAQCLRTRKRRNQNSCAARVNSSSHVDKFRTSLCNIRRRLRRVGYKRVEMLFVFSLVSLGRRTATARRCRVFYFCSLWLNFRRSLRGHLRFYSSYRCIGQFVVSSLFVSACCGVVASFLFGHKNATRKAIFFFSLLTCSWAVALTDASRFRS